MTVAQTDRLTPHAEKHSKFWQNAHLYFDRVYQTMNLDPLWRAVLSSCSWQFLGLRCFGRYGAVRGKDAEVERVLAVAAARQAGELGGHFHHTPFESGVNTGVR